MTLAFLITVLVLALLASGVAGFIAANEVGQKFGLSLPAVIAMTIMLLCWLTAGWAIWIMASGVCR